MTRAAVQLLVTNHVAELTGATQTDGQLLELFVRQSDPDAFALLVHRHGSLVLGVCRRLLRNPADVDDAFQVTFLILARKAAHVGTRDRLAQWLYGVAYNVSRKLLRTNTRRATRERPLAVAPEPGKESPTELRGELLAVLDEEINRLPERYRSPLLLCDLEGVTRKEAARLLGCPEGTVAGRLVRARAVLAARLTARGIAPATALLAAVVSEAAAIALPAELAAGVVRAAHVGIHSASTRGLVSSQVVRVTEGVLRTMFLNKLKTFAIVALLCGAVFAGIAWLFHGAVVAQTDPAAPVAGDPGQPPVKPAIAPARKIVTIVPVGSLDAKNVTSTLMQLFDKSVTVAAVRDENALLVYATEADVKTILDVLRVPQKDRPKPLAEHRPSTEQKKFNLRMLNVPWAEVFDWYARETGLKANYAGKPPGGFTHVSTVDVQYTLVELTDVINEVLMLKGYLLIRGTSSFTVVPADERVDPKLATSIELSDLLNRGKTELVTVNLQLRTVDAALIAPQVIKMLSSFGIAAVNVRTNSIVVTDVVASVRNVVKTLGEIDLKGKEGTATDDASREKKAEVQPKKLTFKMQNVPWEEVLKWYADNSGLVQILTVKPQGTVTFHSPPGRQFTISEITDLINESLMVQKCLLIRREKTFVIVPADERVDPTLIPQIELNDLASRGKTELVEVLLPVPPNEDAGNLAPELQKMLTPFGSVVLARGKLLLMRDTAGNLSRIRQTLDSIKKAAPGPRNPRPGPKD